MLAIMLAFHKHITPTATYGLFCVVAFVALPKIQLDLLPDLAMQRSRFGDTANSVCDYQEKAGDLPVACFAGDWGSVPFYLDRDDVTIFEVEQLAEARHHVEECPSMLLIINDNIPKDQQALLIPEQSQVTKLSTTSKATLLAIQTPQSVERPIRLISAQVLNDTERSIVH